jgi:hypothetical protein
MISLVYSEVELLPPISTVRTFPYISVLVIAALILSAKVGNPKYRNIITLLISMDVGLTVFVPAMLIPECGRPCENKAYS